MNRTKTLLSIMIMLLILTGCSNLRKVTSPDDENLLSGAGSIMKSSPSGGQKTSTDGFEEIDLKALLTLYGLDNPVNITQQNLVSDEYQYRRNDLQERLINASNQRCSAYIRTIVSSRSQARLGWTGLAALLTGATTVVQHAQTVNALAAGGAFSIGMFNAYNEAYFNNLAMTVVSSGISRKRANIMSDIAEKQTEPLHMYPVNAAISDALTYHAACNVVSGMEEKRNLLCIHTLKINQHSSARQPPSR